MTLFICYKKAISVARALFKYDIERDNMKNLTVTRGVFRNEVGGGGRGSKPGLQFLTPFPGLK